MPTLNAEQIKGLDAASARAASGLATDTDKTNLAYASKSGYKYTPPAVSPITPAPGSQVKTDTSALASAVENVGKTPFELGTGIEGYDQALKTEAMPKTEVLPTETTGTDWMNDWMKSAFGVDSNKSAALNTVTAPTFDVEKARLEAAKTSRLQALDATYASDLATVQKNNKNLANSLKARLMKLGVKPTDSAWSNAEAGQLERDTAAETKLRNEYMSNKAKIEDDLDDKITTLAMNEAKMGFDATVKNIENKLQTQAQGINLYQIFSQRDQSEKDREQRAYAALQDYEAKMLTLDDNQKQATAKNIIDAATNGLYNVSDKATLEMLSKMERENPYLNGIMNIASNGLSDRLDKKAEDAAQLSLIKAQTAAANRSNTGGGGSDDKEGKAFYTDVDAMADDLASGKKDWGQAYNFLAGKYGNDMSKEIDTLLNKEYWSQPDAYGRMLADRKANTPTQIIVNP